jgi:hypothetical protein
VRLLLVIAVLALTGCSLFRKGDALPTLPVQPPAPTKPDVVQTLGKDLDKTDHRVASALVAIERNADKPKVVVAESRLAQSYLPAPPEADVAFALARAGKAGTPQGDIDYAKQMAFGRQLATAVNKAWERLEADQAEALRVSQLKDARIVELQKEVEAVRKEASRNIWTLAGVGLAVLGAVTTAFAGPRIGLPLLACGAAMGAFPFVVESPHFDLIVTITLGCGAALLIWLAWDFIRDKVNAKPPQE